MQNKLFKIYQNILNQETSKYSNQKLKGGLCELCKNKVATEIHHLEYQKNAVKGFITNDNSNFNKDHPANLINICEECHNNIHKTNKKIRNKKVTNGYQLI